MKKARVLEIGGTNFGKGGISVAVWNFYSNLDFDNVMVDFYGVDTSNDKKYADYITEHGGKLYEYPVSNNLFIKQINKYKYAKKIAKSNKYDCVHIHVSDAYNICLFYFAVNSFCKNIIVHSHTSAIGNNSNRILIIIKKLLHAIARKIMNGTKIIRIACSDVAGRWMYNAKNFIIVNNGIETSNFKFNENIREQVRSKLNVKNKFVIGNIARFSYEKNHEFLIDTFNEIYKQDKDAVLLLVGNGPLEKQVREKVHKLNLDNAVIFYGTTPNANELYQAMDCFVLPSHYEGMPVVSVEAQAAGLKILFSDTITKETQITDLAEYMSLSESSEKWADKILSYKDSYERKDMSEEIKRAGFDIKNSAKQLEDIYCNLSNSP